jgi:hypothetical protein
MYLKDLATIYLKEQLYPFTITHLIIFIIFTAVTYYITDYFLKFKLIKWIYFGTCLVIAANLYNQGNDKEAAKDIFGNFFLKSL